MSKRSSGHWLLVLAGIVVLATLAGAIAVMGSPAEQRRMRLDERRVGDLRQIEAAMRAYQVDTDALPDTLDVLDARPGVALDVSDPETGLRYEYRKTGADVFELCAVFVTDTAARKAGRRWQEPRWVHGTGRHCFTIHLDEARRKDSQRP
ncbi:MAG: hypothetical protein L0H23_09415 [Luteimonas sp.]|nr:hypothetical protein [Luteimonas sp.]